MAAEAIGRSVVKQDDHHGEEGTAPARQHQDATHRAVFPTIEAGSDEKTDYQPADQEREDELGKTGACNQQSVEQNR